MTSVLLPGALLLSLLGAASGAGVSAPKPAGASAEVVAEAVAQVNPTEGMMYIREYRVMGWKTLSQIEVEEAVYPFMGPGRTMDDVQQAATALEKAYEAKGFKAARVQIPEQRGRGGIVFLQVLEGKVGTLRVKGARYFISSDIRKKAQSLAEGKVINFDAVNRDIVSLNQLPDRRVEPKLTPRDGEPGVFDIELNVKDKLPLHGSLELNNRYSANTTELRLRLATMTGVVE